MKKLTIPKAAMPVVRVLRREVPRPKTLPRMTTTLIWDVLRWRIRKEYYCPTGLHSESASPAPAGAVDFAGGACSQRAFSAFINFWDGLERADRSAAVEAVWPRKKVKR